MVLNIWLFSKWSLQQGCRVIPPLPWLPFGRCRHAKNPSVFAKFRGMKHLHFGFFDHDTGLAGRRQDTCVSKGERVFAQELAGLIQWKSFKRGLEWWEDQDTITEDWPAGSMPLFEGQCASEVLWSAVLLVIGGGDGCSSKGYLCARKYRSTWECSCRIGAFSPEKTVGLITKWNSSTHMHAAWAANRRNWNPLWSTKTMIQWIGSRWWLISLLS